MTVPTKRSEVIDCNCYGQNLEKMMDLKPRVVVEVIARIDWPEPPKDYIEEAMRAQANIKAAAAGKRLEVAAQLLVAEMLNP